MQAKQIWELSQREKTLISSLNAKGSAEQAKNERFVIIDLDSFYKLFSDEEIAVMEKWLAIDPSTIGYKLPYLGAKETPDDIVAIEGQEYLVDGKPHVIPCQFLPRTVHEAYLRLNEAIKKDLGSNLLVFYGHRSRARQIFIFFDILERVYDFDFNKTIQRVGFPDYSEHVCTQRQAIDFRTQNDIPIEEFDKTKEYTWLKQNAHKFHFYESYSKDNNLNMMYEPWHWSYRLGE